VDGRGQLLRRHPLAGYGEPYLEVLSSKPNRVATNHYDAGLPPELTERTVVDLKEGRNLIDLKGYWGIVSFKLESRDPEARIYVVLN